MTGFTIVNTFTVKLYPCFAMILLGNVSFKAFDILPSNKIVTFRICR